MWPNLQETADLVKFTEEIFNGKRHFLCSVTANMSPYNIFMSGFWLNIAKWFKNSLLILGRSGNALEKEGLLMASYSYLHVCLLLNLVKILEFDFA